MLPELFQLRVKSLAPCYGFMSVGEMVRSAHQISAELAEKYRKDILERPPGLAVSAFVQLLIFLQLIPSVLNLVWALLLAFLGWGLHVFC